MNKLQLELWKGKPASSNVVDVMVPPTAVKDFEASTKDMETAVMHDNLGLSIADEQTFSVYAGTFTPHPQTGTSYKGEDERSEDYMDVGFSNLLSKP
jgi:carboxypeptidase A4